MLGNLLVETGWNVRRVEAYPCEVELCLYAYIFAFFFVLCAEDLEFGGSER